MSQELTPQDRAEITVALRHDHEENKKVINRLLLEINSRKICIASLENTNEILKQSLKEMGANI